MTKKSLKIPKNLKKYMQLIIENELSRLDEIIHDFKKDEDKDWDLLNEYFGKILG